MILALGLDVGGSSIKHGVVGEDGRILQWGEAAGGMLGGKRAVQTKLSRLIEQLLTKARSRGLRPAAVGLGFPGTISPADGRVLTAPPQIPGVAGLALPGCAEQASGLPAAALNDADAAGLGEARLGSGRGCKSFLMVTVGSGLGGALILNGALLLGRLGTAGEIGQCVFFPGSGRGPRGRRSRLEHWACAPALRRFYRRRTGRRLMPSSIVSRAAQGEPAARAAFSELGRNLGLGLANAALLVAPEIIAVGGGLSAAGPLLLNPTREAFRTSVLPATARSCRIEVARLGNRAGVVGAALQALSLL